MTEFDTSLSEQRLVDEVQDALGGIGESKISDDTIIQTAERFVVPLLNNIGSFSDNDQEEFDNAVIYWTAEKSFDAWLHVTRMRDAEVEAYIDPKQYREQLRERTNQMLRILGITRPSDIPNTVITVKHDGKKRRVNLQQPWVPEE